MDGTDLAYAGRTANLSAGGGLTGGYVVNSSTVANDGAADRLTGNGNPDRFAANPRAVMTDRPGVYT